MKSLLLLILLLSYNTMSQERSSEMNHHEQLTFFEKGEIKEDGDKYRYQLLLWNLYRFQNMKPALELSKKEVEFFERLLKSDFLLFQELKWPQQAPLRSITDNLLKTQTFNFVGLSYPVREYGLFFPNEYGLGIGTLSKKEPLDWKGFISEKPERTGDVLGGQMLTGRRHKNALSTTFSVKNHKGESKNLLIINVHNLVSRSIHSQQDLIDKSIARIREHNGPVIFAGDFNTWSFFGEATGPLISSAKSVGLKKINFTSPVTFLSGGVKFQMEHLFVKGIHIIPESVVPMNEINLSDHPPVFFEFCLEEDKNEENCLKK